MGELRKIEDEREARECLAAVAQAGERFGPWARAHGIDGRSLRAWHMNLSRRTEAAGRGKRSAVGTSPATLVELVPRPAARTPARYVVAVGPVSVEFGDDFSDDTLRRVLGLLRSC